MAVVDLFLVYSFVRRLTKPFTSWKAFELGVIDDRGNIIVAKRDRSDEQRSSLSYFDVLILNLKRLLLKLPGGASRIATFAAALFLLREGEEVSEDNIEDILNTLPNIVEEYMTETKMLIEQGELSSDLLNEDAPTNSIGNNDSSNIADLDDPQSIFWHPKYEKKMRVNKKTGQITNFTEARNPGEIQSFKDYVGSIKKVDTRVTDWTSDAKTLFANHGFKSLGSGKYGTVFANPKYPYVVKVFMKDTAYLRWLQFAMMNQGNPYVPQIRGKLVKVTPLFFAIRLEKLKSVTNVQALGFEDAYSAFKLYKSGRKPLFNYGDEFDPAKDPHLTAVFEMFYKNNSLIDIHSENIMARGTGQLVVIDPFYNYYSPELSRYTIDPDTFDTIGLF